MLPLLSRLKRIKFIIWAGEVETAQFKRTFPDQDDLVLAPSQWKQVVPTSSSSTDNLSRDSLSRTLATLLEHLPLVSEVHIDILIDATSYLNWDLLDPKWVTVQKWLGGPIACNSEEKSVDITSIQRRHASVAMIGSSEIFSAVFLHQRDPFPANWQEEDNGEAAEDSSKTNKTNNMRDMGEVSLTKIFRRAVDHKSR
ncbi:hypothetical protein CC80DRAFT_552634 [Byssothecium circinans]|uniref:Uncharacterized protein n=1 Tax=Byssothecium circinans TaxID=147558 RepID=A0A6A5TN23_9PLEO|nr:hypothetical protein CC80DRAFT_552634 [Byssothecium circinans]